MQQLKATRVLVGALVTVLGLSIAVSVIPGSGYLRFQLLKQTDQAEAQWIYERIHFDRRPIDVAIVGASNTQLGISSKRLKDNLAARGLSLEVENFGMLFGGRNLNYVLAKQLYGAKRRPKLLIIGLTARPAHLGHPGFKYLADASDILGAVYLFNLNYFSDLAYLPFRQMKLASMSFFPSAYGAKTQFKSAESKTHSLDPASENYSLNGTMVDRRRTLPPKLLKELPVQRRFDQPLLPATVADLEFGDETFYIPKIVELARRHGSRVAFVYLPDFQGPPRSLRQQFYRRYGPVFSADFVRNDERLYFDLVHLNRQGAFAVSDWLTDRIAELLR